MELHGVDHVRKTSRLRRTGGSMVLLKRKHGKKKEKKSP